LIFRIKPSGPYRCLELLENQREGYRTIQRVLLTLSRLDKLTAAGSTDALLRSLTRFGQIVRLIGRGPGEKSLPAVVARSCLRAAVADHRSAERTQGPYPIPIIRVPCREIHLPYGARPTIYVGI
jgi:hypothetical protein